MADLTCDEVLTVDPESSEHFQAGSNLGNLIKVHFSFCEHAIAKIESGPSIVYKRQGQI